jgi:hypothetical protein
VKAFLLYFVIILLVAAFVVFEERWRRRDSARPMSTDSTLGWLVISLFTAIFGGLFIALIVGSHLPQGYVVTERVKLSTLQDLPGFEGKFFLGSGSIGSTEMYGFYRLDTTTGYVWKDRVLAGRTALISLEDRRDGEMTVHRWGFLNPGDEWFGITKEQSISLYRVFHVPAGTIRQGYNLN